MKKFAYIVFVLLIIGVVLQFFRPRLDNPPVTADLSAPPQVEQVLRKSCYNCHSNEPRLSWFDEPVPAYWLVAADIKAARKVLNFSNWDSLTKDQQKGKLFEGLNQATFHTMPLPSYTLMHREAVLSEEDIALLKTYLASLPSASLTDTARIGARDRQYATWINNGPTPNVKPSLNGIAFMPDYKDWAVIGTTDRWDNGTMRAILGNTVAVKAIADGQTHPWPNGTIFAKVAWDQTQDTSPVIKTGVFKQVEFMVKDAQRYASTDGWGFARWVKGLQLIPYGKDAMFTTECTNCHQPMKDNDFVFTIPFKQGPPGSKLIASFIDRKDSTLSVLYGNDLAVKAARSGQPVTRGADLTMVTWKSHEDPHWFGANMHDYVESVKYVPYDSATAFKASVLP
jgi:hypothetical protein